jgi:hypothetical protein
MNTDDLISLLASDNAASRSSLQFRLALGSLAGVAVSLAILLLFYPVRHDLLSFSENWRLTLKFVAALTFAGSAAILSLRLSEPFTHSLRVWMLLLPAPSILFAASLYELTAVPSSEWTRLILSSNALPCLLAVPMLSVPPLIGIIIALRKGAPASAEWAGIAAGAMAAGIGAAVYALHCPDDSPLFLITWYGIAAVCVIVAGRQGGHLLRW